MSERDSWNPIDSLRAGVIDPASTRADGKGTGSSDLQLLCQLCWSTLNGWTTPDCPNCHAPRPAHGWPTLPYTFRNRYLFVRPIGRGGMGAVFLAYDEHQEQATKVPLAVKVVPQASSPEARAQLKELFEREASAAAMLAQAPYFVRVVGHDVGMDPAYLVMEHVEWPTLRDLLRQAKGEDGRPRGIAPLIVAKIGVAVLRGVSVMHYHRIVHRDLKPSNIFFRRNELEDYDIKILDFGVWTREASDEGPAHSVVGLGHHLDQVPVGTYSYMSPEQMAGRPVMSRSDVHTIGSVLWELATGDVPYRMNHTLKRSAGNDRFERLKHPPARPRSMPDGLYDILIRALAFEPTDRWESAEEMKLALKVWAAEEALRSRSAFQDNAGRIETVDAQIEHAKLSFTPARNLLHRIDQLSGLVYLLKSQSDDAGPDALSGAVDEMEGRIGELARELGAFARNVQDTSHRLSRDSTDDIHPEQLERALHDPADYEAAFTAPSRARLLLGAAVVSVLVATAAFGFALFHRGASERPSEVVTQTSPPEPALVDVSKPKPAPARPVLGHGAGQLAVAFSGKADRVVSGGADGRLLVWSRQTGLVEAQMPSSDEIEAIDHHPSLSLAASAHRGGAVVLWDLDARRRVHTFAERGSDFDTLRFSPDGRLVAGANVDGSASVWKVDTGALVQKIDAPRRSRRHARRPRSRGHVLEFSQNGSALAVGGPNQDIRLYNVETGKHLQTSSPKTRSSLRALAISPEGQRVASLHADGQLFVSQLGSGRPIASLTGLKKARDLAWSPADDRIAIAANGQIGVWKLGAKLDKLVSIEDPGTDVLNLRFDPSGNFLLTGGKDRAVRIHDTKTGKLTMKLAGGPARQIASALAPNGRWFVTGGDESSVNLFDASSGALLRVLKGHRGPVSALAFSHDSRQIASAADDGTVMVWTVDGQLLVRFESKQRTHSLQFTRDGGRLISSNEAGTVFAWDLETGRLHRRMSEHKGAVYEVDVSHDGALVASAGADGTLRLWDLETGRQVRKISIGTALHSVRFSPNDRQLATGGQDGLVRIFRTDSGTLVRTHRGAEGTVSKVRFDLSGTRIAAAGEDHLIRIFDAYGPRLVTQLRGHDLPVVGLDFFSDGKQLLSSAADGHTRVWNIETASWRSSASLQEGWAVIDGGGASSCSGPGCQLVMND